MMSRFIDLSHFKHIVALSDASDVRYLQDLVPFYFDALGRFNRILVSRGFILYSKQRLFFSPFLHLGGYSATYTKRVLFLLITANLLKHQIYVEATHHPIA